MTSQVSQVGSGWPASARSRLTTAWQPVRLDLARLTGSQDELVRAVAAANPRTVVVVNAGSEPSSATNIARYITRSGMAVLRPQASRPDRPPLAAAPPRPPQATPCGGPAATP